MKPSPGRFPIVGLGASAGGIPALEGFFKGLPSDCGMAFVVVTHLSPERESLLHEVISRYTHMNVKVAEDNLQVEPNTVYVMPQNAILTIESHVLQIRKPNPQNRERKPIDLFFSSLAKDQGEYSVGIVLSGGDSDGTLGVKAIKENSGLTIAQMPDGSGPHNPEMPRSAIASGLIDIAVPAEQMGPRLVAFAQGFQALAKIAELEPEAGDLQLDDARNAILSVLRNHSGHDFSGYKTKTFFRRVRRRMQLVQVNSLGAYVEQLKEDPGEAKSLFSDLLINVTNFFRDTQAFKALAENVVPRLFEGREAGDPLRVWVPGCATGEEVYSIAILLREHMDTMAFTPPVQIFATDIDQVALEVARAARYPEPMVDSVSAERRRRFFKNDGTSYVLKKEIRELCIFSPHNLIRDPPFSRIDLVSCRNLLIYFGQELQQRIVPTFHYALKPGGYLFLGMSESIGQYGDLFATIDKKHRVFQAREQVSAPRWSMLRNALPHAVPAERTRPAGFSLRQRVEATVLERFSPAHVVVNADGDVVYYSAKTGKYLEAAQGAPTRQLTLLARPGLRLSIRAALRQAAETRRTVVRANVALEDADLIRPLKLTVEPLTDHSPSEPFFLVLFEPEAPPHDRTELSREEHGSNGTTELERELRDTRERLQSTVEEYETALEELKSSNEELVSVNEEAQSTNEELEASKEELQSLNEELNTINAELSNKVEDLDEANNDLRNLFESTRIATVFLDRNLVIRNFTPAASKFFNLLPADIGRPLTDLATRLDYPGLRQHISDVFKSGELIEHRIASDSEGAHYLARLIPYLDGDDGIEGVVVTFIDITSLAKAEEHQKVLISELNHRVKNMLAVVIGIVKQTLANAPSPEAFDESLTGRLQAMGRAYALMTRENWSDVPVNELLRQQVEPHGLERFDLIGPDLQLKPEQGFSLAMVIHEMATNAAKYGALSLPAGKVAIRWERREDRVAFIWKESDGPRIEAPEESGFGLKLLDGEIRYQLRGDVEPFFHPDGLEMRFSFPVA
jgi:two-component system CheB/CheR fusion protein